MKVLLLGCIYFQSLQLEITNFHPKIGQLSHGNINSRTFFKPQNRNLKFCCCSSQKAVPECVLHLEYVCIWMEVLKEIINAEFSQTITHTMSANFKAPYT